MGPLQALPVAAAGFAPLTGSPVLRTGLNLRRFFGIDPGQVGYGGQPLSQGMPDIGAH